MKTHFGLEERNQDKSTEHHVNRLVIDSDPGPRGLNWGELWAHRELLLFFVWRDLKVKYRQTLLGVAWAVVVPLVQMGIFSVLFGTVAGFPTDNIPKPLFYFASLLPWNYFAGAFETSSQSLVANTHFITKIYIPRLLLPLAPCLSRLVDFVIAFAILLGLMLYYGISPTVWVVLVVPLLLIAMLTAYGVGLFFSSLQVRYRDMGFITPFVIQIWMFCTVIVPYSAIADRLGRWAWIYGLNPMAGVVETLRWCLMHEQFPRTAPAGGEMPWALLLQGVPVMLVILVFGVRYFRRVEGQFADVI